MHLRINFVSLFNLYAIRYNYLPTCAEIYVRRIYCDGVRIINRAFFMQAQRGAVQFVEFVEISEAELKLTEVRRTSSAQLNPYQQRVARFNLHSSFLE